MNRKLKMTKIPKISLIGAMVAIIALLLSACAPALGPSLPSAGQGPTPTPSQPQGSTATPQPQSGLPTGAGPAVQALVEQLSAEASTVKVVSVEKVEWSDACLGIKTPGVMCAQVITPGYRVVLEAQGQRYEYHTDLNGAQVKLVAALEPGAQSEVALSWHREGGIAGFCDDLTVYLSGDVQASSCKGSTAKPLSQTKLGPEDLQKLNNWVAQLDSFEYVQKDQATADAMTIRLALTGRGDAAASDAQKQDIQAWAAQLFVTATK